MAGEVLIFGAGGGGANLNFRVLGGTTQPANPKENDIWVNTDAKITSWVFSVTEPNVYDFKCDKLKGGADDAHGILVPFRLKEGDVIHFTIPVTTTGVFEAVRLKDSSGKEYCVRDFAGTAVAAWPAGKKVSVRISNTVHQIGSWGNDGSAIIIKWGSYYHEEGMVWFKTSASSTRSFNALKKNGIAVYPNACAQYVNGALVDKVAKTYQDDAWEEWTVYLIKNGDCTSITGGWTATHSGDLGDGVFEVNANGVYWGDPWNYGNGGGTTITNKTQINFSSFNSFNFYVSHLGGSISQLKARIKSTDGTYLAEVDFKDGLNKWHSIDLSVVNANGYVEFYSSSYGEVRVSEAYLI